MGTVARVSQTDTAWDGTSDTLPVVVVGTDPLCGWCFGIVDALAEARRRLADEVTFEVACGGLVLGSRVRAVANDVTYLRRGLATVAVTTGRHASSAYYDGLLADGTWVSDSEPSVRAVVVAREQGGDDVALDLSSRLSDALYQGGVAPEDPSTLAGAAAAVGLDPEAFLAAWVSPEAARATQDEMERARALGVTTYPSLLLRVGDAAVPLVAGYASADEITAVVRAAVPAVRAR